MSLLSLTGITLRLGSNPVRFLDNEAVAIRNWMGRMQSPPGLRSAAWDEGEEVLPWVDVNLILNPAEGSVLPALPSPPASVTPPASGETESSPVESAKIRRTETHRRREEEEDKQERDRSTSHAEAASVSGQPLKLLVILQRYAVTHAHHPSGPHTSTQRPVSPAPAGNEERGGAGEPGGEDPSRETGRKRKNVVVSLASGRRPKADEVKGQAGRSSYQKLLSEFHERSARRLVEWVGHGEDDARGAREFEARRSGRAGNAVEGQAAATSEIRVLPEGHGGKRPAHALSVPTRRTVRARIHSRMPQSEGGNVISKSREVIPGAHAPNETDADLRAGLIRLDETVRDVVEVYSPSGERRRREHQAHSVAESLERAVEKLVEMLERIVERIAAMESRSSKSSEPSQESERREEVGLRWLDDNDLAGRLQSILRRQVRHRGIDLK